MRRMKIPERLKMRLSKKFTEDLIRTGAAGGVLGGVGYAKANLSNKEKKNKEKMKELLKAIGKGSSGSVSTFMLVRGTDRTISGPLSRRLLRKLKD